MQRTNSDATGRHVFSLATEARVHHHGRRVCSHPPVSWREINARVGACTLPWPNVATAVNTADGLFRLADDLRRERVSEGVDRIMASPVAVDRRPIR